MIDMVSFIDEALILTDDPKKPGATGAFKFFPVRRVRPRIYTIINGKLESEK